LRRTTKYASLLRISEAPAKRDFAKLNLHLPACRSLGAGRALFEQPEKDGLLRGLQERLPISIMMRVTPVTNFVTRTTKCRIP